MGLLLKVYQRQGKKTKLGSDADRKTDPHTDRIYRRSITKFGIAYK